MDISVDDFVLFCDRTIGGIRRAVDRLDDESVNAAPELPLDEEWTVGTALIHAYEELAQHLGHLEITVDLVLSR